MNKTNTPIATDKPLTLAEQIRQNGLKLGFQDVRFCKPDTSHHKADFERWLDQGYQGDMAWLENNLDKRFLADQLHPGTQTVISVRMDYLPEGHRSEQVLADPQKAYVARYALGRDYHKVMRKRLTIFGKEIEALAGEHGYRAFVDSAPMLERQLAEQAGLGWIGKNTLLLSPGAGSWFFLGELCTNLNLPIDEPLEKGHCGSCTQCLVDCPTDAFVSAGVLDARKCISYLTIESKEAIPVELRSKMGNRIYGCDDCQLVCPHNAKASATGESDYNPRHNLDDLSLIDAFSWTEQEFLKKTEGSPIRRVGYAQWQRNIAVALGNAPVSDDIIQCLNAGLGRVNDLVDEHIYWALTNFDSG